MTCVCARASRGRVCACQRGGGGGGLPSLICGVMFRVCILHFAFCCLRSSVHSSPLRSLALTCITQSNSMPTVSPHLPPQFSHHHHHHHHLTSGSSPACAALCSATPVKKQFCCRPTSSSCIFKRLFNSGHVPLPITTGTRFKFVIDSTVSHVTDCGSPSALSVRLRRAQRRRQRRFLL